MVSVAVAEATAPRPETRLAVGYSRAAGANLRLEIRVQRKSGPAWKKADELKQTYPKEVQIALAEWIEIPPSKEISSELRPKKDNPLQLGSSVSHIDSPAGSLGAFVEDSDGKDAILSCSHVLALAGKAKRDDLIIHPGLTDLKTVLDDHQIALLKRYSTLSRGKAGEFDAAYATLNGDVRILKNLVPPAVGAPKGLDGKPVKYKPDPNLGQDEILAKVGRTTGYTEGVLSGIAIDNVPIQIHGIGIVHFDNCIEVRWKAVNQSFTKPGDSGSLVFTRDELTGVGIHFAAGEGQDAEGNRIKTSYACGLTEIMAQFKLSWI